MLFYDIYNSIKRFNGSCDSLKFIFDNQSDREKMTKLLNSDLFIECKKEIEKIPKKAMEKVISKNKKAFEKYKEEYLKIENKDYSVFKESVLYENAPLYADDFTQTPSKVYFFEFLGDKERMNDPKYHDQMMDRIFRAFIYNTEYENEYDFYCESIQIQVVKDWCDRNHIKYREFLSSKKEIIAYESYNAFVEINYEDSKMYGYRKMFGLEIKEYERCIHRVFKKYDDEYISEGLLFNDETYNQMKKQAEKNKLFIHKKEINPDVKKGISILKHSFDYLYSDLYLIYNKTLDVYNKVDPHVKRQEIIVFEFDDRINCFRIRNFFV